jgi:hypothetical protein
MFFVEELYFRNAVSGQPAIHAGKLPSQTVAEIFAISALAGADPARVVRQGQAGELVSARRRRRNQSES